MFKQIYYFLSGCPSTPYSTSSEFKGVKVWELISILKTYNPLENTWTNVLFLTTFSSSAIHMLWEDDYIFKFSYHQYVLLINSN